MVEGIYLKSFSSSCDGACNRLLRKSYHYSAQAIQSKPTPLKWPWNISTSLLPKASIGTDSKSCLQAMEALTQQHPIINQILETIILKREKKYKNKP